MKDGNSYEDDESYQHCEIILRAIEEKKSKVEKKTKRSTKEENKKRDALDKKIEEFMDHKS